MYRIEVYTRWKRGVKTEVSCESDYIDEILFWFRDNWYIGVKKGSCYFYLYKDGKKLTFTETKELGFYERID